MDWKTWFCVDVFAKVVGRPFTDVGRAQEWYKTWTKRLPVNSRAKLFSDIGSWPVVTWASRTKTHWQCMHMAGNYTHIKLIPKTIGNRKRDCAWGCAWGINTTWENLQIEKHKSVRWAERTPSWFVLFDLQIFSGGVYSPSATSRTISFSISNSFWY